MEVYLDVPFEEKDEANELGAKWDMEKKLWFAPHGKVDKLTERWERFETEIELHAEDRTYGDSDLYIDLVPTSCWNSNVRTYFSQAEWTKIRKYVCERSSFSCECCNDKSEKLEVHERWDFNEDTQTQKLVRLVALCNICHLATHMGYAGVVGMGKEAKEHLKKIRNFTDEEFKSHHLEASTIYQKRSKMTWKLDLSFFEGSGVKVRIVPDGSQRAKSYVKQNEDFEELEELK